MDETETLQWILSQSEEDSIEELTGSMLDKLIEQTRHLVVLFCKYIGYALIAVMHTCHLLKHYSQRPPPAADDRNEIDPNLPLPDSHFMPVDRVKGLAMEN